MDSAWALYKKLMLQRAQAMQNIASGTERSPGRLTDFFLSSKDMQNFNSYTDKGKYIIQ